MSESIQLWVCGKVNPQNFQEWEFQGVFDSEEKARNACTGKNHFIGPATLNESLPPEPIQWPGAYYPQLRGSHA